MCSWKRVFRFGWFDPHTRGCRFYRSNSRPHFCCGVGCCGHNSRPHNKSGVYCLTCKTCNLTYVGETSRNLKTRFQEHIRYVKTNSPQSAHAQHILHNQHEYGTLTESITLLKPLQNESMLLPFEQFHIQSLHQAGKLIPEQYLNDPNPLFQLTFSHPQHTRYKTETVHQQHPANRTHNPQLRTRPTT